MPILPMIGKIAGKLIGGTAGKAQDKAISGALGAGQMISGMIKRKKADQLLPSVEDKMSRDMLLSIQRRKRGLETGTADATKQADILKMSKMSGANAFKTGGGGMDAGGFSRMAGEGMKSISEGSGQQIASLLGQEQQQVADMTQRKFDLGMYRSQTKSAQAEQEIAAGRDNLMTSFGGGKKKKKDKNQA